MVTRLLSGTHLELNGHQSCLQVSTRERGRGEGKMIGLKICKEINVDKLTGRQPAVKQKKLKLRSLQGSVEGG